MRPAVTAASSSPQPKAEEIFSQLSGRWALDILLALAGGRLRFTDLRRAIPKVSAKILTARLREMELAGLVARSTLPPPTSAQTYELGTFGRDLVPTLDHLAQWRESLLR